MTSANPVISSSSKVFTVFTGYLVNNIFLGGLVPLSYFQSRTKVWDGNNERTVLLDAFQRHMT